MAVLSAASLSGCVAAAIPIVAAGAIAGTPRTSPSGATSPGRSDATATRSRNGRREKLEILPLKELPPPDGVSVSPFDDFAAYAVAQHLRGSAGEKRDSAIMAPDSTLSAPTVVPCDARPTAVFVDSDLRDGGPLLVRALATLRAASVRVLWALNDGEAEPAASMSLKDAGFVPGDIVLPPPSARARKQTIRQVATIENCVVAIAGRRRSDMDELYDYLRNPDTLVPSDVLWNRGWFLIPATPEPRPVSKGTS